MKFLSVIFIVTLLFGNGPIFGGPTTIPANLDQLYDLIETGQGNWTFSPCAAAPQPPYLNWSQVKAINQAAVDDNGKSLLIISSSKLAQIVETGGIKFTASGTVNVSESTLFSNLFLEALKGNILACAAPGEKVTIYGNGVQALFDKVAGYAQ